jgi:hypothetical protein
VKSSQGQKYMWFSAQPRELAVALGQPDTPDTSALLQIEA